MNRLPVREDLTFDEVTMHFHLPIVEACTKLGVCSSLLKKICKEHGIPRWPYRKIMSGTSVDEIKVKAATNLQKLRNENSLLIQQQKQQQYGVSADSFFRPHAFGSGSVNKPTPFRGASPSPSFHSLSFKPYAPPDHPFPYPLPQYGSKRYLSDQRRTSNTFLEDFKLGFPSHGLRTDANKWWGGKRKREEEEEGAVVSRREEGHPEGDPRKKDLHLKTPVSVMQENESPSQSNGVETDSRGKGLSVRNNRGGITRKGKMEIGEEDEPGLGERHCLISKDVQIPSPHSPSPSPSPSASVRDDGDDVSLLKAVRESLSRKSDLTLMSLKFGNQGTKNDELVLRYVFGDTLFSCAF